LAKDDIRRRVSRTAGCSRRSSPVRQRVQIGEDARIARVRDEQVAGRICRHAARIAQRVGIETGAVAEPGGENSPLPEHAVCDGIAGAREHVGRGQRLIEFEHAIIVRVRHVEVCGRVYCHAFRKAHRRGVDGRAAEVALIVGEAAVLSEDQIRTQSKR
jgi:hypothetical protein